MWEAYYHALTELAGEGRVMLPTIPPYASPNYHTFFLRVRSVEVRDRLLRHLRESGIGAAFHFIPLHSSPFGHTLPGGPVRLPITEECSRTLVRLPLYPDLAVEAEDIADRVADVVRAVTK